MMDPPPPSPASTEASSTVTTGASSPNPAFGEAVKTKEEKLKELYQELEKLQSSFPTEESMEPGARYKDHWNEDDWEKDFESHPIFMSKAPENPEDIPAMVDALRQLKYDEDFNSKTELAANYKKDGNENFRLKKYRWAIDAFTAGIKQQCEDKQLNSQLYGNRAAAHFRLGNYRSSVKDSMTALKLNPDNKKAGLRVAESLFLLKDYRECVEYCKAHIKKYPELEDFLIKCLKELQNLEEEVKRQREKEEAQIIRRNRITQMVKDRGIKFIGDLFVSNHPAAANYHVECTVGGQLLWPVIFIYPQVGQTDFVPDMHEDSTLEDQLDVLLGDPTNRPAWDQEGKFIPKKSGGQLKIGFFDSDAGEMVPVDPKQTLKQIMTSSKFVLASANPIFTCIA
jgi:tetratricopeptide (TPR) repeat protein